LGVRHGQSPGSQSLEWSHRASALCLPSAVTTWAFRSRMRAALAAAMYSAMSCAPPGARSRTKLSKCARCCLQWPAPRSQSQNPDLSQIPPRSLLLDAPSFCRGRPLFLALPNAIVLAQNDNSAPRTTKVAGLFQFNTPSQPLTALTAHGAAPLPANWVACCHLRLRLARPGVGQRCLLRRGEGA